MAAASAMIESDRVVIPREAPWLDAFLAPNITTGILDGTQPVDLTAEKITQQVELPLSRHEQRRVLGFA
jgi:hypothetical protein